MFQTNWLVFFLQEVDCLNPDCRLQLYCKVECFEIRIEFVSFGLWFIFCLRICLKIRSTFTLLLRFFCLSVHLSRFALSLNFLNQLKFLIILTYWFQVIAAYIFQWSEWWCFFSHLMNSYWRPWAADQWEALQIAQSLFHFHCRKWFSTNFLNLAVSCSSAIQSYSGKC